MLAVDWQVLNRALKWQIWPPESKFEANTKGK